MEEERFFTKEGKLACVSLDDGTSYIGMIVYERKPEGGTKHHNDRLEDAVQVDVDFEELEKTIKNNTSREFKQQPVCHSKEDERKLAKRGIYLIKDPLYTSLQRFTSALAELYNKAKEKQPTAGVIFRNEEKKFFATGYLL